MSRSADKIKAIRPAGRPIDVQDAQARYAALIDKKFASTLSEAEQGELRRLEAYLNEIDSELYEPIKRRLQAALRTSTRA